MIDYLAIDSDAHVGEPADLWTSRLPEAGERVPHVRFNDAKSREEWWIGDEYVTLAPAGTVAGSNVLPPGNPKTFGGAHPGAFDVEIRKNLMDQAGVWAQVLYPNVPGFGGQKFMTIADEGLRLDCVKAYNDYLLDWIAGSTDRFVPVCIIPFWDLEATLTEVRRCHGLGHRAILMTGKPDVWWSMPHIADPYWDALWSLATELEMSISFHAGGSDPTNDIAIRGYHGLPLRTRFTANAIPIFFGNAQPIVDLIFGGVVERFPRLKFVIVESGLGWISFLLELMDYQFHEHRVRDVSPELVLDPSEYFRRQIYTTFWFERVAVERLIDHVGLNNVMFETDFPHPTSLWPPTSAREQAEQCAAAHPVEIRERILWRNAAELYGLSMPVASAAR